MPTLTASITNALTIDVEDYFQVSAFERNITKADWGNYPCRVENNIHTILEILQAKDITATFFTLGWVAEKFPLMIREIMSQGHEIASHGMSHVRVTTQTKHEFKKDVINSKKLLEDIAGTEVKGYRAASFSINESNMWALEVLLETGHIYSSSVYPVKHDLYGMPSAPRFPYRANSSSVLEIPISTVKVFGKNYPCGGGGYFRLYPYILQRKAIETVNKRDKKPFIFYFHPWEIDLQQPRIKGLSAKTKFRHYLNLNKMESKLNKLVTDFKWSRMDHVFSSYL